MFPITRSLTTSLIIFLTFLRIPQPATNSLKYGKYLITVNSNYDVNLSLTVKKKKKKKRSRPELGSVYSVSVLAAFSTVKAYIKKIKNNKKHDYQHNNSIKSLWQFYQSFCHQCVCTPTNKSPKIQCFLHTK